MKIIGWTNHSVTVISKKFWYEYECNVFLQNKLKKLTEGHAWQLLRKCKLLGRRDASRLGCTSAYDRRRS